MDSDEASFKFELGLLGNFQKTGWFDTECNSHMLFLQKHVQHKQNMGFYNY